MTMRRRTNFDKIAADLRASIVAGYRGGQSCSSIAKSVGLSVVLTDRVLREAGIERQPRPRNPRVNIGPRARKEVRDLWIAGLSYRAISERLGIKPDRVRVVVGVLQRRGEIGFRTPHRPIRGQEAAALLLAWATGLSQAEMARQFGINIHKLGYFFRQQVRKALDHTADPPAAEHG
jgi:DNA-binding CsgD family transcriptional regulator